MEKPKKVKTENEPKKVKAEHAEEKKSTQHQVYKVKSTPADAAIIEESAEIPHITFTPIPSALKTNADFMAVFG